MQPTKEAYGQDEICYIRLPQTAQLFKGRVCGEFQDPGVTGTYYIIKLDNFSWPHFEIRDWTLMSPTPDGIVPAVEGIFNPNLKSPNS